MRPQIAAEHPRVVASLPFVEQLARRVAATMPHSIDIGDLVQDGVIGLIDAAHRFDESRGIKFETFAERRIRGAMIDALRKDAWPRGVRRQRAYDRGFVLSDHADWPALLDTIAQSGANRVIATHGHAEPFARYLREQGLEASVMRTAWEGEAGADTESASGGSSDPPNDH